MEAETGVAWPQAGVSAEWVPSEPPEGTHPGTGSEHISVARTPRVWPFMWLLWEAETLTLGLSDWHELSASPGKPVSKWHSRGVRPRASPGGLPTAAWCLSNDSTLGWHGAARHPPSALARAPTRLVSVCTKKRMILQQLWET